MMEMAYDLVDMVVNGSHAIMVILLDSFFSWSNHRYPPLEAVNSSARRGYVPPNGTF